jgi:hypothetical protein
MDILNFISWIKGKRQLNVVDPAKTLLPIGIKDGRRDDDYLTGAISVADFISQVGTGTQGPQGIPGVQGPQGNDGPQGIQGETGAALTVLGSYPDLASFLAGAGGLPGNAGEAWIILSDGSLEVWNTDTNLWDDAGDLLGPQGPQGIQGIQGDQGIQGQQGIQGVKGDTGAQGPTGLPGFFAQTADSIPVVNTALETTIIGPGVGTLTVPANAFSVGDSFQCALDGILTCGSSATLHIRVKTLAGVLLADTGIIDMAASTDKSWIISLYFTIRTLGGPTVASISSGGLFSYIRNGGTQFEGYVLSTINTTTFDTTVNNTLVITAQWDPGSIGNSITTRNFTLTKVF